MFLFSFKLSSETPVTFKSENIEKYAELCMIFLKTKKAESIFFQGDFIAFRKVFPVYNTHPFSLVEQPKIYFMDNENGILKLEYTFALKWF
ncbi:MAG: hypothetical protein IT236_03820 [Bacteroidia bacterium]|nr:hypothetical protein [Bacteroidia bacterium]